MQRPIVREGQMEVQFARLRKGWDNWWKGGGQWFVATWR